MVTYYFAWSSVSIFSLACQHFTYLPSSSSLLSSITHHFSLSLSLYSVYRINIIIIYYHNLIMLLWFYYNGLCPAAGVYYNLIFFTEDKNWSCKKCNKWYKHRDSLRRHIRDECGKMPRHQCNICQAYFYHRHNLKTHSISKHHILIWTRLVVIYKLYLFL